MVEVIKIMATSFQRSHAYTAILVVYVALQPATADPHLCRRLLDTHGQVWVSLLWGHCSSFLGSGAQKVLFVPSKSLFRQSCVRSGSSVVGLMVTSSKRAYAIPRSTEPRASAPAAGHCQPTPPPGTPGHSWASLGQSLVGSLLLSPGSWCPQGSVCALQESISQSCVSSGTSMVGLMATSSKRACAVPRSAAPRVPDAAAGHC